MTKALVLIAAFNITFSGAVLAASYKLDDKGKCHDEHGKFAKQELCEKHAYRLDLIGKCRDEHGKFAAAKFCHA